MEKTITIEGKEYKLQSPSLKWFMDISDKVDNSKISSYDFTDAVLRNAVVSPPEIKAQGVAYFNEVEGCLDIIQAICEAVRSMFRRSTE